MPPRRNLPPNASVATPGADGRLHAPAADRNAGAILDLLHRHAPVTGTALELASGTGQHAVRFAAALPGLQWQPSEVDAARRASIDAWVAEAGLENLRAAIALDAAQPGWGVRHGGQALVLLVNLLHLIGTPEARTLIREAAQALAPGGRFILYGPFLRDGAATSDGDRRFHASLQASDPAIGYKNDADVARWLREAGLPDVATVAMPANNLAFVAGRG